MRRFLGVVCVAATCVAAYGQGKYILIDGSSTVFPIAKLAAEEFQHSTYGHDVQMKMGFSGTTGGFRKFLSKEIDVACASRPIAREEIKMAKEFGISFIEIPIGFDALTVAVHPENTWVDSIKASELKTMWERAAEGKITKWNQIRSEWPDQEIKLFGAGHDSGTFDYFAEVIAGKKTGLRSDYTGSEDDNDIVSGIESHRGALGFLPYCYFTEAGKGLKPLAIEWDFDAIRNVPVQAPNPVKPSAEAVLQGIYIPLGRPLFLYVNKTSLEAKPHLRDFLQFFLIDADTFVAKEHYVSLPTFSYARSIADLESKRAGTRFSGEPEVGVSAHDLVYRRPR